MPRPGWLYVQTIYREKSKKVKILRLGERNALVNRLAAPWVSGQKVDASQLIGQGADRKAVQAGDRL